MTLSGNGSLAWGLIAKLVLIPLLVDDPLWARKDYAKALDNLSLNPSFSG